MISDRSSLAYWPTPSIDDSRSASSSSAQISASACVSPLGFSSSALPRRPTSPWRISAAERAIVATTSSTGSGSEAVILFGRLERGVGRLFLVDDFLEGIEQPGGVLAL